MCFTLQINGGIIIIEQNDKAPIIIAKTSVKGFVKLTIFCVPFFLLISLLFYKNGIVPCILIFLGNFCMLLLIEVWVLFTLPASLELHSNQIICTKFLTNKIIALPYKDIQEIIFKDRSTGRGKDIGYYLIFKCVQNVKRKIPIGALIQDREKQAELIQFILQKNPCIRFPYRPRQSNDDIWLGWWIKL